jgi:nitrogenase molybdenum-iron protein alpha/beta subunit
MTKDIIKIINAETGEEIEREMTDEEQALRDAQVAQYFARQAAKEAAVLQAETDKAALLAKLGITADEAKLLLN